MKKIIILIYMIFCVSFLNSDGTNPYILFTDLKQSNHIIFGPFSVDQMEDTHFLILFNSLSEKHKKTLFNKKWRLINEIQQPYIDSARTKILDICKDKFATYLFIFEYRDQNNLWMSVHSIFISKENKELLDQEYHKKIPKEAYIPKLIVDTNSLLRISVFYDSHRAVGDEPPVLILSRKYQNTYPSLDIEKMIKERKEGLERDKIGRSRYVPPLNASTSRDDSCIRGTSILGLLCGCLGEVKTKIDEM